MLKESLHRAGHYLNPYTFIKRRQVEKIDIFIDGLVEIMHRFHSNRPESLEKITYQLPMYQYQKSSFGRDWARSGPTNPNLR